MKLFKLRSCFIIMPMAVLSCFISCSAQEPFGTNLLKLEKEIALPSVKGRIDHMDINLKARIVYVAALGNNSLEAVRLTDGKIIHSIKGLDEPQGVGYIPQRQEIIVANGGSGDCYFYNANSFEKVGTIHLSSDADDIRYDSASKRIYIGYGEGGIAVIDADTHKQIGDVKLPAHPESFQIDKKLNLLFVNLPNAHMVASVDLTRMQIINKWVRNVPTANFPMALDEMNHRVIIGYRHPARLVVLDGKTGKEISINTMVGDADDLYYDGQTAEVYVSGGDGYINIFRQSGADTYKQIANILTRSGARTSLFVPQLKVFVLAARAQSGKPASLLIYKTGQ
jgi:hypothetical protein